MGTIKAIAAVTALCALVALFSGCSSRPVLAQVDSSIEEQPINSPEAAQAIKAQVQKSR